MNCSICNQPVVLSPSAAWRAERYGGSPADYVAMFPQHADCIVKARARIPAVSRPVPVIMEHLELIRLRRRACMRFGIEAGTRETAAYVNGLGLPELRKFVGE